MHRKNAMPLIIFGRYRDSSILDHRYKVEPSENKTNIICWQPNSDADLYNGRYIRKIRLEINQKSL